MERKEVLSQQSGKGNTFSSRIRVFILVLVAGLIGYSIGVTNVNLQWQGFQPRIEVTSKEPPPSDKTIDFSTLWTVMNKLTTTYYDRSAIDPQKFLNGAIMGMVSSLDDPYTVYLPPTQNTDFKQGLAGQFEGIGAELGTAGKQIIVVAPLDGSPAQKAGLRAGDAILEVDGAATAGWSLAQTVDKIRGEKGTAVTLTILGKSEKEPKEVPITRDTITVKSVNYWVKNIKDIDGIKADSKELKNHGNDKVIYIRLSQFGDNTNKEWQDAASWADRTFGEQKDVKGIVLDLRNNPGGYLTDAVYVGSEFIKDGAVVMQEDRQGARTAYPVNGNGLLYEMPLVVLVNRGSASASEIVAGALQDHKRATLVGEKSFGKGTIQAAEDLGGGAGLHITIAKWLTPDGRWIHKIGLTPDVAVALDPKDQSHDTQLEKAIAELEK